jgi:hypothetical protein
MVGNGNGNGNGMRRIGTATGAVLAMLALGPLASARAAGPNILIEAPSTGTQTNQQSPLLAGSTDDTLDSISLSIYEGQNASGVQVFSETTLPVGNTWSLQASPLAEGTYTAVAGQVDSMTGEPGLSPPATFTIDTTLPVVSLNAVETPTNTPGFSGSAGTMPGDVPTVTVTVHAGTIEGAVVASGEVPVTAGKWSYTPSALGDGTYTAQASQGDEAGNVGTSAARSFAVDTTAPAVSLNPIASSTNDNTPTFGGAPGGASGDVQTVTVTVHAGTSLAGPVVKSGTATINSGTWTYTPSSLASDDPYTVQATQADTAGNVGTSVARTFTLDTSAPQVAIAQTPSPSKNRAPTFTWTAGTAERDSLLVRLVVLNSKHEVVREGASSMGSWTIGAGEALDDGTYSARAEQSDEAGNTGSASETFIVDNVPPAVSIASPGEGAHLKTAKPDFSGTSGAGAHVTLNIYQGNSTTGEHETLTIPPDKGGSWSESEGPHLADGTYTAQALQADAAGNVGEARHTFTIETNTPHVTLDHLPEYTNDATPGFGGTVDRTKGVVESVTLRIFKGASAAESAELAESPIVVSGNGSTWGTSTTGHLADGMYTAQAEQENEAGTPGFSTSSTFTVDTLAPQPTLSAPAESSGLETVSGTAGTADGDRRQVTAELFAGATTEGGPIETITVIDNQATGAWTATFAGLAAGQYTVIARQSDEAGNTGFSAPQMFTVNAPPAAPTPAGPTPPVASFTWLPATPTVGQSVSFVSKSIGASSPITAFGWDMAGSGPFAAGGALTTATFATAGAHTVRLQVSDALGQSSTAAETVMIAPRILTLMQPFPIVRIAGAETAGGARIRLLSVQAPPTAKVAVSCKGRGCKTKTETRVVTASSKRRPGAITLAFPRFQRALGAGAVLQIRITKSGQIGKFTSFTIRRKKLPVRVDECLRPPSTRPSRCPSQ